MVGSIVFVLAKISMLFLLSDVKYLYCVLPMKTRKPLLRRAAFAATDSVDGQPTMDNEKLLVVALTLALMLSSCAAVVPPRGLETIPPGHLYAGNYINARAPNSDGWRLISTSASGLEFARVGEDPNESFGAQVLIFPLGKTQGPDEFIALIKRASEDDINSDRYTVMKSEFLTSEQRSYPCVSGASVVEDRRAQTSRNKKEKLLLEIKSLYCRHPVHQETGFSIIYSYRGYALYPNLNSEAKDFIDGVQVPGH